MKENNSSPRPNYKEQLLMSDQMQFDDILAPKGPTKKKGEGNMDNEDLENESIEEVHQIENDQ